MTLYFSNLHSFESSLCIFVLIKMLRPSKLSFPCHGCCIICIHLDFFAYHPDIFAWLFILFLPPPLIFTVLIWPLLHISTQTPCVIECIPLLLVVIVLSSAIILSSYHSSVGQLLLSAPLICKGENMQRLANDKYGPFK